MKKIFILLFIVICISCESTDKIKIKETIKFEESSTLKFEDIISECEIIPIKLNGQIFLNDDIELSYINNTFYLVDYNINNTIVVVSNFGEFQNCIGTKGNGNGEYINLRDYYINNDTVTIYTDQSKEEYRYLKSGKFIGKNKIKSNFMQVLTLNNNRVFYYIGYDAIDEKNRVVEFYNGSKKNTFLKHSANILSFTEYFPVMIPYDGGIIIRETISNVLYHIDKNNKTSILYNFDFGDKNIPKEYYTKSDPMDAAMELMSKKYASTGRLLINENYIIQQFNFNSPDGRSFLYGIKDIKNNKWKWIDYSNNESSIHIKGPKLIDNDNNIYFIIDKEKLSNLHLKHDLYANSEAGDLFIVKYRLKL